MAGQEKDHLVQSVKDYFKVQSSLKDEAVKLAQERLPRTENDRAEPNQKVEPGQSE